jgi:hypothetical protein
MNKNILSIADWINVFVDSVLKYSDLIFKDSNAANHQYERFTEAVRQLGQFGDDGLSKLAGLLNDERIVIRVTAASYLIHFRTDEALRVLRAAAKQENRAVSMLAIVTLKRWETGSYLDPVTGKEVKRKGD